MRIQRDALIAGFPANRIGELLRQSDDFLSCRHATKILGLDENKARYLLDRLDQEGFVERNTDVTASETEHYWKRTLKGNALSKALFSRPVSRQTAEIGRLDKRPLLLVESRKESVDFLCARCC